MKPTVIILLAVVVLASCQKHKENKAWKEWYGTYNVQGSDILMYDDFHGEEVYASRIAINKYGISFSTESGTEPSCTFSKLPECDNSGFDYQLSFDEITLFVFGSGGTGQVSSPSKEELNDGIKFYLKRLSDSKILFIAHGDNQQEYQHVFNLEE